MRLTDRAVTGPLLGTPFRASRVTSQHAAVCPQGGRPGGEPARRHASDDLRVEVTWPLLTRPRHERRSESRCRRGREAGLQLWEAAASTTSRAHFLSIIERRAGFFPPANLQPTLLSTTSPPTSRHTRSCTHTCTHKHSYAHTHVRACTHVHMHTCTYMCAHEHTCPRAHTRTHTVGYKKEWGNHL